MIRRIALVVAVAFGLSGATVGLAQESRPGPGGGMMGPGMSPGMMGPGHHGGMQGGMMRCPEMMGQGMMGMMMSGADPKALARAMRFRADMLKAMGEVLQRHAEQLEKGQ
jgi:hypothetical protein